MKQQGTEGFEPPANFSLEESRERILSVQAHIVELLTRVAELETENAFLRQAFKLSGADRKKKRSIVSGMENPPAMDERVSKYARGNLSEIGLRDWIKKEVPHPETGIPASGRSVLRSAFYGKGSFWKELERYANSLSPETIVELGGKIPVDKGSYALKLRKAGFSECSPKNLCVWLEAISPEEAQKCDKDGFLSME